MNKKDEKKEVVLRSIKLRSLNINDWGSYTFGFFSKVQDVSFVKVFNNVVNINAYQGLRVYYLDKQIKEYIGMDEYYYPSSIYYITPLGAIDYYELVRKFKFNIVYNNVKYDFPIDSLVLEIKEIDAPNKYNNKYNIESIEGNEAFDRITIETTIIDRNCISGSPNNDFFCNRFLENSKNVKNIIFISKSPIQSKYASSIDGLLQV